MSNISNLSDTIVPKSDQMNADDLLGGPVTILVTNVSRGSGAEQPISIHYEGDDGRPFKPCKTVRKLLVFAWGEDGNTWIGRSMTLYNDPAVMYGGVKVGGIRVSHLSDIEREISVSLTTTRGKKAPVIVKRLEVKKPVAKPAIDTEKVTADMNAAANLGVEALRAAWTELPKEVQRTLGKSFIDSLKPIAEAVDKQQAEAEPAPAAPEESVF